MHAINGRDRFQRLYVEVLLALGGQLERAQALRIYRRFAEQLMRELDAEPDEETSRLAQGLQEGVAP